MSNIRNSLTELIPETERHHTPVVPHFEEFHTSVLKIKKSTTELSSAAFSLHFNQPGSHLSHGGRGGDGGSIQFLKGYTRKLKLFCSSTCFITEQKEVSGYFASITCCEPNSLIRSPVETSNCGTCRELPECMCPGRFLGSFYK